MSIIRELLSLSAGNPASTATTVQPCRLRRARLSVDLPAGRLDRAALGLPSGLYDDLVLGERLMTVPITT
jgi:hypothetical protein